MKKLFNYGLVVLFMMFLGVTISSAQTEPPTIECIEAEGECLRVKFGNEVHIFPGEKVTQEQQ